MCRTCGKKVKNGEKDGEKYITATFLRSKKGKQQEQVELPQQKKNKNSYRSTTAETSRSLNP